MTTRFKGWGGKGLKGEVIDPEAYVGHDAARNEEKVRQGFARKAKRFLRLIPLASEAVAAYFCMLDGRTPLWVKGTVAAALAYFILPIDALPDFLPVVGMGDDAGVIAAALTAVSAYITEEHRRQAHEWLEVEHIVIDVKHAPASSTA
ncbi:MAG: YkvA family protein [Isosphaeraceae bacterium]